MKIHFVGIGGIGMSGLARYFKSQGYAVSGSDVTRSGMTNALMREGIQVAIGHKPGTINKKLSFVVYNRAIALNNPELVAAKKIGVPIVPYATILGRLTEQYATIAITGSHGKSTTTALAGLALIRAGLDPTVLVGTNLTEFAGRNLRIGKGPYLVLEADDFGAAFLAYSPVISMVTNIDREHMDFYKTLGGVKKSFLKFMARTQEGGALILNRDDATLFSLKKRIAAIAKKKKLRVVWYATKTSVSSSAGQSKLAHLKKSIKIAGEHNLSNAMAVLELGKVLNLDEKKVLAGIGSYRGAWRRMEYRGELLFPPVGLDKNKPDRNGRPARIKVFDDYAHHPTEIKATLQAFREKFPGAPLVCVFQPHQTKRLQVLFNEFVSAFDEANVLILIPPYKVAGRDEAGSKFTSRYLAAAIYKKYPHKMVFYTENPKHIKKTLRAVLDFFPPSPDPVVIMMGAGDIFQYTKKLIGSQ